MHIKFDENLDARWRQPLEQAGHQVTTVAEEGLQGSGDPAIAQVCRTHGFCLITADLDFTQTVQYPPDQYAGLVVLRHPKPTLAGMANLVCQVATALGQESPVGCLWIVEPGRLRIYDPPAAGGP
jgi:predicted nuclease of predicted toxin-antitoxin system